MDTVLWDGGRGWCSDERSWSHPQGVLSLKLVTQEPCGKGCVIKGQVCLWEHRGGGTYCPGPAGELLKEGIFGLCLK